MVEVDALVSSEAEKQNPAPQKEEHTDQKYLQFSTRPFGCRTRLHPPWYVSNSQHQITSLSGSEELHKAAAVSLPKNPHINGVSGTMFGAGSTHRSRYVGLSRCLM